MLGCMIDGTNERTKVFLRFISLHLLRFAFIFDFSFQSFRFSCRVFVFYIYFFVVSCQITKDLSGSVLVSVLVETEGHI